MSDSLKRKTGFAFFWSFVDKGGQQIIQFIFVYILARLLIKDDFGLVAALSIFTSIANILQESGFSSALIRKKTVHPEEYSSVFYFNISISIFLYLILFFFAPFIGDFFEKPILTDLSRFLFLSFVFNAFGIVQNVNLVKKLDFKINTRITFIAGFSAGLIAVYMSYSGFGVWSLAASTVIQSFLRSLFLWIFVKWKPTAKFSFRYIKSMSSFSLKLLMTGLMNHICANIYPLIIGKSFSISEIASYGQATKLNNIPQSIVSDGIKSVAYPLISNIDNDIDRVKKIFRKIVRITSFISFPVACILIVIATPFIGIYLPPEWADVAPKLQILAIGGAFYPLYVLVSLLLQHQKKVGVMFNLELMRNIMLLLSIVVTIRFGVLGLVMGISTVMIIAFLVGIYFSGKYISYSLKEVFMDVIPYMVIAIISFIPTLLLSNMGIHNIYLLLILPLFIGCSLYLLITKISGSVVLQDTIDFIKQFLR